MIEPSAQMSSLVVACSCAAYRSPGPLLHAEGSTPAARRRDSRGADARLRRSGRRETARIGAASLDQEGGPLHEHVTLEAADADDPIERQEPRRTSDS